MKGFVRGLLLAAGLVLVVGGCIAGPQPDPPNESPSHSGRWAGDGVDDRNDPMGMYVPGAEGEGEWSDAGAAPPSADAGPTDPGTAGFADESADSDTASPGTTATENHWGVYPKDAYQPWRRLDGGTDSGCDDGDTE